MDLKDFEIKTIESHLKQISLKYDECIADRLAQFFFINKEENENLFKDCDEFKEKIDELLKKYDKEN
jgi:hypothetical protein